MCNADFPGLPWPTLAHCNSNRTPLPNPGTEKEFSREFFLGITLLPACSSLLQREFALLFAPLCGNRAVAVVERTMESPISNEIPPVALYRGHDSVQLNGADAGCGDF